MRIESVKTYGVNGLIDWQAQITLAGGGTLVVNFTGGALTGYGVTPATYTTRNYGIQHMIEQSDYFKSGRIRLLSSEPLFDGKTLEEAVPGVDVRAIRLQAIGEDVVTNCADARRWLKENKGVNANFKSKQEIIDLATENGVRFVALEQ